MEQTSFWIFFTSVRRPQVTCHKRKSFKDNISEIRRQRKPKNPKVRKQKIGEVPQSCNKCGRKERRVLITDSVDHQIVTMLRVRTDGKLARKQTAKLEARKTSN